jgi:cob(I)alamin adenosyltransferase
VILDEINLAVDYGLLSLSELLKLIDSKPESVELILTGRNTKPKIMERTDLVREMVERKHYYNKGVPVRGHRIIRIIFNLWHDRRPGSSPSK